MVLIERAIWPKFRNPNEPSSITQLVKARNPAANNTSEIPASRHSTKIVDSHYVSRSLELSTHTKRGRGPRRSIGL